MDPKIEKEQQEIINEHKGMSIDLPDGTKLHIRPLTLDEYLGEKTQEDMKEIFKAIASVPDLLTPENLTAENLVDTIFDVIKRATPSVRRLLSLVMDRPLKDVDGVMLPEVLGVFLVQNFPRDRLKPLAGLLGLKPQAIGSVAGPTTISGTSFTVSSPADTQAGEATPATSSNSTSGAASGSSAGPTPMESKQPSWVHRVFGARRPEKNASS